MVSRSRSAQFRVSGNTTDDLIARIDQVVDARPAAISLLIGTNDLGHRLSVEHLVRNVEFLLVSLRRELPGTRMLVQSIMPRGREFAEQLQDANRHLRQFSSSVNAQYLDLWPAFAQDDGELNPDYSTTGCTSAMPATKPGSASFGRRSSASRMRHP